MHTSKLNLALKFVRDKAGVSQKDLAAALSVDQSRISRIENGSTEPTPDEVKKWLARCPSPETMRLELFLGTEWPQELHPTWDHPDLDVLALAADTISRIDRAMVNMGDLLRSQLALYQVGLRKQFEFLVRRDHRIAFVGPVGVGKTTVEALAADLVATKPGAVPTHKDVILPVGAGRTTVCEISVEECDSWGIIVEPESDESIKVYVDDLCATLMGVKDLPPDEDRGVRDTVPQEIGRALKNMADLPSWATRSPDGGWLPQGEFDLDGFRTEFFIRLRLPARRTTELSWSEEANPSPLVWLRQSIQRINNGNFPGVSLPKRIRIQVGRPLLDGDFRLTLLDTRGVDQNVARPDLCTCLADARTATILCSTFFGAPDLYTTQLLKFASETGITGLPDRTAILVLAKSEEALNVRREFDGEPVEDAAEGYAVKAAQVALAMRNLEPAGISVEFFNASADRVEKLRTFLKQRVNATRDQARRRVHELADATAEILDNPDAAAVRAAQKEVASWLRTALRNEEKPGPEEEAVYRRLVDQIATTHPRTIWAMVRRSGEWENLNVPFFLGASAASDAVKRTEHTAERLRGVANTLRAKPEFEPAQRLVDELEHAIHEARSQLVGEIKNLAETSYGPAIKADHALWAACAEHWGNGKGFRDKVARDIERWFESKQRAALDTTYSKGYEEAWKVKLINPLARHVGTEVEE